MAIENSVFRFFEHPVHFAREQAYEGKYVIQTEEPNLSAVEAVRVYKELSEVERAFASLKDIIEMRPIHHRTADRVQAHIFVASLALLIHRAIEITQGSGARPLGDRSSFCAQVSARRRHRACRWQHQTMRHPADPTRRRHPARARHLCHQATNATAA